MIIKVHFLSGGLPLCGFSKEVPKLWPQGHMWIHIFDTKPNLCDDYSYCDECLRIWKSDQTR